MWSHGILQKIIDSWKTENRDTAINSTSLKRQREDDQELEELEERPKSGGGELLLCDTIAIEKKTMLFYLYYSKAAMRIYYSHCYVVGK